MKNSTSIIETKDTIRLPYKIEYSPETLEHLQLLKARQRSIVLNEVEKQLQYQPTKETRNRKFMRPNQLALWELRIGKLRVYYDVEEEPEATVLIRAVGLKERNRLYIGRQVIEL